MKIGDLVLYYSSIKRSAEGPRDVGLITGFSDVVVGVPDDADFILHRECGVQNSRQFGEPFDGRLFIRVVGTSLGIDSHLEDGPNPWK